MTRIKSACGVAADGGCRPVFIASLVDAIDQELIDITIRRNDLAAMLGWPLKTACNAVICSARWNAKQETVGSDAGGKERQRSRTKTDSAGESRQTSRRRA